jgi:hypothetical protein
MRKVVEWVQISPFKKIRFFKKQVCLALIEIKLTCFVQGMEQHNTQVDGETFVIVNSPGKALPPQVPPRSYPRASSAFDVNPPYNMF